MKYLEPRKNEAAMNKDDMRTAYFKRNGKKIRSRLRGFPDDLKECLEDYGLDHLRECIKADKDSPVMVIAK